MHCELRLEDGKANHPDRTCTLCAKGEIEDEAHVLLYCSAYVRERSELYRKIQFNTQFDLNAMRGDDEWLLQILIGVGCSQRQKRLYIQLEVANICSSDI